MPTTTLRSYEVTRYEVLCLGLGIHALCHEVTVRLPHDEVKPAARPAMASMPVLRALQNARLH